MLHVPKRHANLVQQWLVATNSVFLGEIAGRRRARSMMPTVVSRAWRRVNVSTFLESIMGGNGRIGSRQNSWALVA